MTAKDKAKELVDKYKPLVTTLDCYSDSPRNEEDIIADAKKCALVAVEEILNEHNSYHDTIGENLARIKYNYWNKVKAAIENL